MKRFRSEKGGSLLMVLLLMAILCVILLATKPDEKEMRDKIAGEFGSGTGAIANIAGSIGEMVGAVQFKYEDYLLFALYYMQPAGKEKELLGVGCAGQVFTSEMVDQLKSNVKGHLGQDE